MKNSNTYLLHTGSVNGNAFGVFATLKSNNIKTGNMVQISILLLDQHPVAVVQSGLDADTICQGCPFASGQGCYVEVGKSMGAVWGAYQRGNVPRLPRHQWRKIFKGRFIRFGSYGNPSLIPLAIVKRLAKLSGGWTGYYHDWHLMKPQRARAYGEYFMASTDSSKSYKLAQDMGLRAFHVGKGKEDSIECLANTHGLQCIQCQLCKGNSTGAKNIFIPPHGAKKGKVVVQ